MADLQVKELAQRRWEQDRALSMQGDRDLAGIAVRGGWDDEDSLCQTYLREAAIDLPKKKVLKLDQDQVEALKFCLDAGWQKLDDGFPEPRDTNRKIIDSIRAEVDNG